MEALLKGWGCHVLTATSISEALERIRASKIVPDVILADYHLDEGTGIEAVEAVRAAIDGPIPAVIITADQSPEVQRDVRWRGYGLLRKPLKAAALRAVLTQMALRRSAAE